MYYSIFFYSTSYNLLVINMIIYLKSMLYTISIILITTILLTIFNYFNIVNGITLKIIMLIIPLIGIFIGSFKIGKETNRKGYIEGIKYSIIWILLLTIINLIINNFTLTSIIYYIIIIFISSLAGIIGINKRKN